VALLAVLAAAGGAPVSEERLVAALWPEDRPAHERKALQVVVTRARAATSPELVVHDGSGYRLGVPADRVDSGIVEKSLGGAEAAWRAADPVATLTHAANALTPTVLDDDQDGPLGALRHRAQRDVDRARRLLGLACSATGEHQQALVALEDSLAHHGSDEEMLAALLRSEAAVRGPAAALNRYEQHRRRLAESTGADPGPALQQVQAELLAADRPERHGVRADDTTLVGRDDDIRAVQGLLARHRVVTLLGPGGLGKTRLANEIGQRSNLPVVHVVELAGVAAADDVTAAVGETLGIRDLLTERRTLQERRDLRSRIAQRLRNAPTLLIVDNCEHVVTEVADLVAWLVAAVPSLRVVTTSRAPLSIAAEHVHSLPQLGSEDAAQLFIDRARAARPDAALPPEAVEAIIARLDGLPLAIELAAAKIRVMSADDLSRRLDDRFALLRGGTRSVPDRHRTLLAVIDWSWSLLDEIDQEALRRLSAFPDGFVLPSAEHLLAADPPLSRSALDCLTSLVEQSLLTLRDGDGETRYRMLETIREFGLRQLTEVARSEAATTAVREWAAQWCLSSLERLYGAEQIPVLNALSSEESTLTDLARQALALEDVRALVPMVAALTSLWQLTGSYSRIIESPTPEAVALLDRVVDTLPDHLLDATRTLLSEVTITATMFGDPLSARACGVLRRVGSESEDVRLASEVSFTLTVAAAARIESTLAVAAAAQGLVARPVEGAEAVPTGPSSAEGAGAEDEIFDGRPPAEFLGLADSPNARIASLACQWTSHWLENEGDLAGAIGAAHRALVLADPSDGPVRIGALHAMLAQEYMQIAEVDHAARHARLALQPLGRLRDNDDTRQLRSILAVVELFHGRTDAAEAIIDSLGEAADRWVTIRTAATLERAEIARLRGNLAEALRLYREQYETAVTLAWSTVIAEAARGTETGFEPWTLFAESACLVAHARHLDIDDAEQVAFTRELAAVVLSRTMPYLRNQVGFLDHPVAGSLLFSLAWWHGRHTQTADRAIATLLVLADRFGYNRNLPLLSLGDAIAMRPGLAAIVEELRGEYGNRHGTQLDAEAIAVVAGL